MGNSSTQIKTFKYRLYPTRAQEKHMLNTLDICRHWYNMCLEDRMLAYKFEKRNVGKYDQYKMAILYRKSIPYADTVISRTFRVVVDDLDRAFAAFFRRVKIGDKPGYPRFKGRNRFNSFGFKEYGTGVKIEGNHLKLFGIGYITVRWHRSIEGKIKTVRILHKAGRWYACFACEIPDSAPLPKTKKVVGIDVGLASLVTLSDGSKIEPPQFYREGQRKLKVLQRSLAHKVRGSKNRQKALLRVQRQHEHMANQRSDFAHKLSHKLVQDYDKIACEDLRICNMVRNHHLSKSILDAGWGIFKQYLTYKAANAGREILFVDPAYTSKCCSNCGTVFENFSLSTRWVRCSCGLSLDRDHNAAINILSRTGWDTSIQLNVAPLPLLKSEDKRKRAVKTLAFQAQRTSHAELQVK